MKKRRSNRRCKPQLFSRLPPEIVIDILSRLPIRTIVFSKCVCRSWRDLLRTREFADFHLSKSVPGLLISDGIWGWGSSNVEILEFDDEHHDLRYSPLTKLDFSGSTRSHSALHGSANGLLLLRRSSTNVLYVCNPVTREYIDLPHDRIVNSSVAIFTSGIGVSRMSGQHKVVSIFHKWNSRGRALPNVTESICLVYTLGTGMWRAIMPPARFLYDERSLAVCVNGNLHWLVQVLDGSHCICCFDLETETFSMFHLPPLAVSEISVVGLVVLGDWLCVCDASSEDEVVIWLMKEDGDEKSWKKEFVIRKNTDLLSYDDFEESDEGVHPIKLLKNGDIFMVWQGRHMIYYSNKTQTTKKIEVFGEHGFNLYGRKAARHTSSFSSLGSFVNESVSRF